MFSFLRALTHEIRQREPVCSVLGKTYGNECFLHKEACRKRRRTGLAHMGPCLGKNKQHSRPNLLCAIKLTSDVFLLNPVSKSECSEEELGQFPFRLLDWFLLLTRMGKSYVPAALPQSCLSYAQRTQLAQV